MSLYEKLKKYGKGDYYGYHMPGHKRNMEILKEQFPFDIDITEIDGFDNLHIPNGILKEAQEKAAGVFHSKKTYFLINGSTVGILSGILGTINSGESLILGPDCHKAVYHALKLGNINGIEVENGRKKDFFSIRDEFVSETYCKNIKDTMDKYPDAKGVVITSPNYEGFVADVKKIADMVHQAGKILIVDEAHGAHLGFHPYFPNRSNDCGADVVIQSLHKNLPALTQTALLHINGNRVIGKNIQNYLHMLQTSSPSYVLMASMDACVRMLEEKGEKLFSDYVENLKEARRKLKKTGHIHLYEPETENILYDYGKLIFYWESLCGDISELYDTLRKDYHLQMEMMGEDYIIGMTSIADTKKGMERLVEAILELDEKIDAGIWKPSKDLDIEKRNHKEICYRSRLEK